METLPLNYAINPSGEGKWHLFVSGFEAINFVFKITDENHRFFLLHQGLCLPEEVQKLFTNYKNY